MCNALLCTMQIVALEIEHKEQVELTLELMKKLENPSLSSSLGVDMKCL